MFHGFVERNALEGVRDGEAKALPSRLLICLTKNPCLEQGMGTYQLDRVDHGRLWMLKHVLELPNAVTGDGFPGDRLALVFHLRARAGLSTASEGPVLSLTSDRYFAAAVENVFEALT